MSLRSPFATSIVIVACAVLAAGAGTAHCRSWLADRDAGREFADLSRARVLQAVGDASATLPLEDAFHFRGALYDTLELGPAPGVLRLTWTDGGSVRDHGGLTVLPAGTGLRRLPGASVQLRRDGDHLALRWTGLADAAGEPAAFDVLLESDDTAGDLVIQWLQVPLSVRLSPSAVIVRDLGRDDAQAMPLAEGLALRPGSVVSFPGDAPWRGELRPATGCDIARPWCDVVRERDPGCTSGGGTDLTSCSTTEAKRWHFREGQYCRSCPYTFYITVECGTEIHLPFRDMEGNQISITNVFTGVEEELEALNDCAKSAFQYCDYCASFGGGIDPDPLGTACPPGSGTPRIDCIPYLQRSTLIQWGYPLFDRDGDTVADDLPCGPPNTDACIGYRSGAWPAHEEQNTDVLLRGGPALCGVFRIDVLSGGFDWFLSANCTGIVPTDPAEIERNFRVYQNCADALAAFDPVPELAITKLEFTGVCPDIVLEVEVTNLGCVDAPASPVHLDFSARTQADLDVDLGVVGAGTSVRLFIPVTLVNTPQDVIAAVDPLDVLSECTEQAAGSFSGCTPASGADSLTATLCSCVNTVVPALADDSLVACNGVAVAMDASSSSALPCFGGTIEYRILDAAGAVVRDWSTDPVAWLTPGRCPAIDSYTLQVRCSLETGPDCERDVPFTVECAEAPALGVTASAETVCQGDPVTITASPGFGSYAWEDGRAGRVISERPAVTTTYRVTATTAAGCVAMGEVTVNVTPDPIPGPLGASVRVTKSGQEILVSYAELPGTVGTYELLLHAADGTLPPCAASEPPTKPDPATMQAAASIDNALPGDAAPQLRHPGGVERCPDLLFYKVIATSPCRFRRGPACNGFPHQLPPCP